jgi:hypothetical protein
VQKMKRFIFGFTAAVTVLHVFPAASYAAEIPKPVIPRPVIPTVTIPRPNVTVPKPNITVNVPKPVVSVNVPRPNVTVNVPKAERSVGNVSKTDVAKQTGLSAVRSSSPEAGKAALQIASPTSTSPTSNAKTGSPPPGSDAKATATLGSDSKVLAATSKNQAASKASLSVDSHSKEVLACPNGQCSQPSNKPTGANVTTQSTIAGGGGGGGGNVTSDPNHTYGTDRGVAWNIAKDGPVPPGLRPYVYYVSDPSAKPPAVPTGNGGNSNSLATSNYSGNCLPACSFQAGDPILLGLSSHVVSSGSSTIAPSGPPVVLPVSSAVAGIAQSYSELNDSIRNGLSGIRNMNPAPVELPYGTEIEGFQSPTPLLKNVSNGVTFLDGASQLANAKENTDYIEGTGKVVSSVTSTVVDKGVSGVTDFGSEAIKFGNSISDGNGYGIVEHAGALSARGAAAVIGGIAGAPEGPVGIYEGAEKGSSLAGNIITAGQFVGGKVIDGGFYVSDVARGYQPVPLSGNYYIGEGQVTAPTVNPSSTRAAAGALAIPPVSGNGTPYYLDANPPPLATAGQFSVASPQANASVPYVGRLN